MDLPILYISCKWSHIICYLFWRFTCFESSSVLEHALVLYSFLWFSHVLRHGYTTVHLFGRLQTVVLFLNVVFRLLKTILLWTCIWKNKRLQREGFFPERNLPLAGNWQWPSVISLNTEEAPGDGPHTGSVRCSKNTRGVFWGNLGSDWPGCFQ